MKHKLICLILCLLLLPSLFLSVGARQSNILLIMPTSCLLRRKLHLE